MRHALVPLLAAVAVPALAQSGPGMVVPTRYDEHRWIARPVTAAGDTLELYTDSGGGVVFIARDRLRGASMTFEQQAPTGDSLFTMAWPAFRPGMGIPEPLGTRGIVRSADNAVFAKMAGGLAPARDGFLGNDWFAGRTWVFDYPAHVLRVLPAGTAPRPLGGATVPLGFRVDSTGAVRPPYFPRLRVLIDGDSLDLLLDTGATTMLTDSTLARIGDGRPATRAASFITRTTFDRWHARHPDWRVLPGAEQGSGADMIEVPSVSVGGLSSGPVWFTARADRNFHTYMSQWMDRPIEGAFGGSGLHYFRVVVDYPNRRATFSR